LGLFKIDEMEIIKENVRRDTTSCNFCQKGELNKNQNGLVYPYENVVTFRRGKGGGLCACICEECLDELYKKAKIEFSNDRYGISNDTPVLTTHQPPLRAMKDERRNYKNIKGERQD